mgnify:CR=1 FL=1
MFNPEFLQKLYTTYPPATLADLQNVSVDLTTLRSEWLRLDTSALSQFASLLSCSPLAIESRAEVFIAQQPSDQYIQALLLLKELRDAMLAEALRYDDLMPVISDKTQPSYLARLSGELAEAYPNVTASSDGSRFISLKDFMSEHDSNGELYVLSAYAGVLLRRIQKLDQMPLNLPVVVDNMASIAQAVFRISDGIEPFSLMLRESPDAYTQQQTHCLSELIKGELPPALSTRSQLALYMFSQILCKTDSDWFRSHIFCYETICNTALKAIEILPSIVTDLLGEHLLKKASEPQTQNHSAAFELIRILRCAPFVESWENCIKRRQLTVSDIEQLKSVVV